MTNTPHQRLTDLADTLISLVRIVFKSRPVRIDKHRVGRIIILGNGPSLKSAIADHLPTLQSFDTLAVNFMANTPEFEQIKPAFYVLADPHFFVASDDENVNRLWQHIADVSWRMTLFVPHKYRTLAANRLHGRIHIQPFNCIAVEGCSSFTHFAYRHNWGMPRPRNVLIPSIILAIQSGYSEISIVGADHSWLQTISVDDQNNVVSIQPHFYKDNSAETNRNRSEYKGYRLHDILKSFYIAFRAYHQIERYAQSRGVKIFNATPNSFIDAFERKPL